MEQATKRGPGRPRKTETTPAKPPQCHAAPDIDRFVYKNEMRASLDVSMPTFLDMMANDPEAPPLCKVAGRMACLATDWNAFLRVLAARPYQARDVLRERTVAKRAREAAARDASAPTATAPSVPVPAKAKRGKATPLPGWPASAAPEAGIPEVARHGRGRPRKSAVTAIAE